MSEFEKRYKSKEEYSLLKYKKDIRIGIFGAFAGNRYDMLKKIKEHLINRGL